MSEIIDDPKVTEIPSMSRQELWALADEHIGVAGHIRHWQGILEGVDLEVLGRHKSATRYILFKVMDVPRQDEGPVEPYYMIGRVHSSVPERIESTLLAGRFSDGVIFTSTDLERNYRYDPKELDLDDVLAFERTRPDEDYPPIRQQRSRLR